MAERTSLVAATATTAGVLAYIRDSNGSVAEWLCQYPEPKGNHGNYQREMAARKDTPEIPSPHASLATFVYLQGDVTKQIFVYLNARNQVVARSKESPESEEIIDGNCLPGTALALAAFTDSPKSMLFYQGAEGDLYCRNFSFGSEEKLWISPDKERQYIAAAATGTSIGVAYRKSSRKVTVCFQNEAGQLIEYTSGGERWEPDASTIIDESASALYHNITAVCSASDDVKVYAQEETRILEWTRASDNPWERTRVIPSYAGVQVRICQPENKAYLCYFVWYETFTSPPSLRIFTSDEDWPTLLSSESYRKEPMTTKEDEHSTGAVNGTAIQDPAKVTAVKVYHTEERVENVILVPSEGEPQTLYNIVKYSGKLDTFELEPDEELTVVWDDGTTKGETRRIMFGTSFARTTGWYGLKSNDSVQPQQNPGLSVTGFSNDSDKPFVWANRSTPVDAIRIISSLEASCAWREVTIKSIHHLGTRYSPFAATATSIVENANAFAKALKYLRQLIDLSDGVSLGADGTDLQADHLRGLRRDCANRLKGIHGTLRDFFGTITAMQSSGNTITGVSPLNIAMLVFGYDVLSDHIDLSYKGVGVWMGKQKKELDAQVASAEQKHAEAKANLTSRAEDSRRIYWNDLAECYVAAEETARQLSERTRRLRDQTCKKCEDIEHRFLMLKNASKRVSAIYESTPKHNTMQPREDLPELPELPAFDEDHTSPNDFARAFTNIWSHARKFKELEASLELSAETKTKLSEASK